ncbi:thymidylate synthase [bacterium]|nr:thymidylate synthase [bacterium]
MKEYMALVTHILTHGEHRTDRTGTGTRSVFGYQLRIDLRNGFPLLTTKKVLFDKVVAELLWFLRGDTHLSGLGDARAIWAPWANEKGELGPIYGHQWRQWTSAHGPIDQLKHVMADMTAAPDSRRLLVSAWNVGDIPAMALPPCHVLFQFYVSGTHLDLQLYQRSADVAVGVPFNIASYALLLTLVATHQGLTPRYFIHTLGDAHIYDNHVAGLTTQLKREPRPLPTLSVDCSRFPDHMRASDIELKGYHPHPFIKFPVAV